MDNWINEAFESVQNQKQLTLDVDLFSKIEQKLNLKEAKIMKVPIWKVAAAACLILNINVFAIKSNNSFNNNKQVNEYHLTTNYNLYTNE
ncbi:MAG: hypothetical protein NWQ38_13970 [Cellulophaga sp.]|nr:hypothetical protein [Cellulophaga sp.]